MPQKRRHRGRRPRYGGWLDKRPWWAPKPWWEHAIYVGLDVGAGLIWLALAHHYFIDK